MVKAEDLPTLRMVIPPDMKRYISPNKPADLTVENIGTFIDDVAAGNVKAHLKSQPVPES